MKALITFQPNKKLDYFEGSRLRKTIKGALELNNVEYTTSIVDEYDVVHLLAYSDFSRANDAIAKNIPVIASVMMCEGDSSASYLDFKFDDGEVNYSLSNKALKFLNKVDHVIVPCDSAREFLINQGVTSDISVIMPGVNLARFDFTREDEKCLFFRYFREDPNRKLVISNGEVNSLEGITAFIEAGKKCPEAIFYFFVNTLNETNKSTKLKAIIKKAPKNVHFTEIVPDDIYRSALINASIFMLPCYRSAGVVTILEAMAAKCELIMREQKLQLDFIKDGETAHIARFSETLSSLVKDCLDGKIKSTVTAAYEESKKYSLEIVGEKIKWIYQQEMNWKDNGGNNND